MATRLRYKLLPWTQSDSGSVAPLVAGYLSLLLLVITQASAVISALTYANRVQGVADLAVIYAHERSLRIGKPDLGKFEVHLNYFLDNATSAKGLEVSSFRSSMDGTKSRLELCARFQPLFRSEEVEICKVANAQSYLVS